MKFTFSVQIASPVTYLIINLKKSQSSRNIINKDNYSLTAWASLVAQFSLVQFSHSIVSDSLRSHELQHARLPCPSPTPRACSLMFIESVMPSNHLILCYPPLLLPSIFPRIRVFSNEVSSLHQMAKVLELQL